MRILVIGDTCIDEYHYGTVKRLNPESTAHLMDLTGVDVKMGMAHNVRVNLEVLGARVHLRGPEQESIKRRYVDRHTLQQLLRVDTDVRSAPYRHTPEDLQHDAIVIVDYNKGFVDEDTVLNLRDDFDGPIYMDTKKTNLAPFYDVMLKINELEFSKITSAPPVDKLVVTLGAGGAMYRGVTFPATPIEVFDVCGAGDTFLASMVYEHMRTHNIEKAIAFANKQAAITCSKLGVFAPCAS